MECRNQLHQKFFIPLVLHLIFRGCAQHANVRVDFNGVQPTKAQKEAHSADAYIPYFIVSLTTVITQEQRSSRSIIMIRIMGL